MLLPHQKYSTNSGRVPPGCV